MMRKLFRVLLATIAVLLAATGCVQKASAEVLKSDKPRDTSPQVSDNTVAGLVNGNNTFALKLYHLLGAQNGNIFFSPYSISEALAMTYAGARGQTAQDMAKALDFNLPQESLHPAFNQVDLDLAQRGKGAKGKNGEGFQLKVVNAIWGQQGFQFQAPYLDTLAVNYDAGLRVVDFIKQPEQSRTTINRWVEDQTASRIKDLLPPGSINAMTRLILTNAIYFNAAWLSPFQKSATADGIFNRLDASTENVPMMKQTLSFRYAEGDNFQAVELPYDGRDTSMVVLLPASGKFNIFEQSLDAVSMAQILNSLSQQQVALTMPKFQYDSTFGLKQALSTLGMSVAFTDAADFSGMDGKRDLLIQDVLHKAFVSVDEAGTEAAAASAVIVGTTAMPVKIAQMTIDRPFIFLIRDNPTGSILFLGRVLDPGAK